MTVLQRRHGQIRSIMNYWHQGNLNAVANALQMMNDPSVAVDFFSSTFAKDLKLEMLNYETIKAFLPHAE